MEYDRKRMVLTAIQFAELLDHSLLRIRPHPFGQAFPGLVPHIVDVAIRAVQVAAARNLQKDGVDAHIGSAVMSVVRPVVGAGDLKISATHLLDQAGDSWAGEICVEARFCLVDPRLAILISHVAS